MKKSEALNILGLSDGASDDDVKKAHRKLVIAHHPDKFPLDSQERADAEELTKRINEARDVLLNRSWTPEFDPRRDPRPYAGNPYVRTGGGSQGGSPQGHEAPWDPFAAGWPFASGQGQTTYVWTSWDGTRTSGTGGRGSTDPFANWPFDFTVAYDADPFSPFSARAPRKTPAEHFAEAKEALSREAAVIGAKAAALAVLALLGSAATGLFVYVMASIVYGLYKRLGSCLVGLIVPIALIGAPLVFMIAPRSGSVTAGLAVAFFIAVAFDVSNMRDRIRAYRTYRVAKESA